MDTLSNLGSVLAASLATVWVRVVDFIPNILGAVIVFIIGLFVADLLGKLVAQILNKIYLDKAVESTGLKTTLAKVGFKATASHFLGLLVTWFLYAVTLIAAAEILNLNQISEFLQAVVLYIPNVIIAVVILIIGIIVSNFVGLVVKEASLAAKLSAADFLARLAKWAILIFSFLAALVQLRVAAELIQILFTGVILMLALAGGIAFGLGGKDKAKELIDKLTTK